MTFDYVLRQISYQNLILYSRTIQIYNPSSSKEKGESEWDPGLDANDPDNFTNNKTRETIRR